MQINILGMTLPSITKIKNLKGKRVLLRLDLNVPVYGSEVRGDFRIKKSLKTIRFLKKAGAKTVIISHISKNGNATLKHVARYMNKYTRVGFVPRLLGDNTKETIFNMRNGSALILENLRSDDGEISNDIKFAKQLSSMADIYVNDAFAVSHRKHASIIQLPKLLPAYIGILFEEEIKNLSLALRPPKSALLILGGAKIETKLPLLKKYANIIQNVFVGGALANTILKEKGFELGKSLVGDDGIEGIKKISANKHILLPSDVVVKNGRKVLIKKIEQISSSDIVMDIGPLSTEKLKLLMSKSKMIVLNGPLGNYERGFDKSTVSILKEMGKSKAKTIIGGGDTAFFVSKLKLNKKLDFISTGGGAMLEFLSKGTLPGIEAIKK